MSWRIGFHLLNVRIRLGTGTVARNAVPVAERAMGRHAWKRLERGRFEVRQIGATRLAVSRSGSVEPPSAAVPGDIQLALTFVVLGDTRLAHSSVEPDGTQPLLPSAVVGACTLDRTFGAVHNCTEYLRWQHRASPSRSSMMIFQRRRS